MGRLLEGAMQTLRRLQEDTLRSEEEMKDFEEATLFLKGPLYISLDIDALDPAHAPGVSHHEPGGMTTRQLIALLQAIEVPVVGADIVECNPERDINNVTAMVSYKLMKELIQLMLP